MIEELLKILVMLIIGFLIAYLIDSFIQPQSIKKTIEKEKTYKIWKHPKIKQKEQSIVQEKLEDLIQTQTLQPQITTITKTKTENTNTNTNIMKQQILSKQNVIIKKEKKNNNKKIIETIEYEEPIITTTQVQSIQLQPIKNINQLNNELQLNENAKLYIQQLSDSTQFIFNIKNQTEMCQQFVGINTQIKQKLLEKLRCYRQVVQQGGNSYFISLAYQYYEYVVQFEQEEFENEICKINNLNLILKDFNQPQQLKENFINLLRYAKSQENYNEVITLYSQQFFSLAIIILRNIAQEITQDTTLSNWNSDILDANTLSQRLSEYFHITIYIYNVDKFRNQFTFYEFTKSENKNIYMLHSQDTYHIGII